MTISLCMIVRDEESILARCLESVQDLVEEIVVVDTGSRDSTRQIAARYAHKVLVLNHAGVAMYDDVDKVFSRAREITDIGLSVPQVTRIFMGLRERGFGVSDSVYTLDYATRELLDLLGKGAGGNA